MRLPARLIGALLLAVAALTAIPAAAQTPPPKERPTAEQLFEVYAGKTWIWEEGAGYFSPDRRFVAWSGSGETATYASGTWRTSDLGRMCFDAVWENTGYDQRVTTCFSHRVDGETIYQAREPNGTWYIFRHDPLRQSDEYLKLVGGDSASATYEQLRKALGGEGERDARRCFCWCKR